MNEEWKKGFHNKLDDYEMTPPEGLFDEILKNLPSSEEGGSPEIIPMKSPEAVADTNRRKRGKAVVWFTSMLSAAAVGTLLLLNSSIFNVTDSADTNGGNADVSRGLAKNGKREVRNRLESTETFASEKIYTNDNGAESTSGMNMGDRLLASAKTAFNAIASSILPQGNGNEPLVAMTEQSAVATEQPITAADPTDEPTAQAEPIATDNGKPDENTERTEQRKRQRFTAPVADNRPRRSDNHVQLGVLVAGMPVAASSSSLNPVLPTGAGGELVVTGQNEIMKKANHHQPITFGVSIALPLSSRTSIETGLMYSYHYSELTYEVGTINHEIKQRLNFVGIPLNLNYQLWRKNNVVLYASGGGSVEKMVYGKQREEYDGAENAATNKVKMKELQWALSARFGAAYKLTPGVSLYLEPGVAYHFGKKSELQTIYSDRPVSFQLKAGLRFNLR